MAIHQMFFAFSGSTSQNPTSIIYNTSVSSATTSTTIRGPTIPNYVDDTYIGVLMEYTSSLSGGFSVPSGWTLALTQPSPYTTGAGLSICYKILSTADRNTAPGTSVGGNQRDQLFVFRNQNGAVNSITTGNFQASSVTGGLSANAPSITSSQSAIAVHFFYNSTTSSPSVSASPTMTLVRNTNLFTGAQYLIYNGTTPSNQSTSATLAGTIRQALVWLVVS
jgi:hypothetical protein